MALETGTYISDLVVTNPPGSDPKSQMDDHLRLIKSVMRNTFPSLTGAMTATQAELNWMVGATIQPAMKDGSNLVTPAAGDSSTKIATTAFVAGTAFASALPAQTGNAGKFVTTNGITASWAQVYPTQTGNAGRFLTTDGTNTSWAALSFQTAATSADLKTGTDNTKVSTASGLLAAQGFTAYVQTADQPITTAGALTIAHNLGRTPVFVLGFLRCVTGELGYTAGDILPIAFYGENGGTNRGFAVVPDATNLNVRYGNSANVCTIVNKTTGNSGLVTNANWSFFLRALA